MEVSIIRNLKPITKALASLAVGWYLLAPPVSKYDDQLRTDAPLTEWDHLRSFDSAADCEAAVAQMRAYIDAHPVRKSVGTGDRVTEWDVANSTYNAECYSAGN